MQRSHLPSDINPRLPAFLVLGTQKGGTTSLFTLLSQHPQVYLPGCKEVHYFSLNYELGPDWYAKHFSDAFHDQLCGDITPYYLFHPQAPARIHALLPEVRFVILLRDPVERAISQYFHAVRHGFEPLSLKDALALESDRLSDAEQVLQAVNGIHYSHQKHSYKARGHYQAQIEAYREFFEDDQFLVLKSEGLFRNSVQCWQSILTFLGLEHHPAPVLSAENSGEGESIAVPESLKLRLREEFVKDVEFVRENYGFDWGW